MPFQQNKTKQNKNKLISFASMQPVGGFADRWHRILDRTLASDSPLSIVVVGAGAGGVELCLSMQVIENAFK
jgi:NADH dehydrogenase FAD-containing subunit